MFLLCAERAMIYIRTILSLSKRGCEREKGRGETVDLRVLHLVCCVVSLCVHVYGVHNCACVPWGKQVAAVLMQTGMLWRRTADVDSLGDRRADEQFADQEGGGLRPEV